METTDVAYSATYVNSAERSEEVRGEQKVLVL